MTEAHDWSTVRQALSPFGMMVRVENKLGKGTPDLAYCLRRVSGWLELKHDLSSLTLDQVMFAEGWAAAGGLAFMLWRRPGGWAIFNAAGMRALYSKTPAQESAILWESGPFPLKAVLTILAPRR